MAQTVDIRVALAMLWIRFGISFRIGCKTSRLNLWIVFRKILVHFDLACLNIYIADHWRYQPENLL